MVMAVMVMVMVMAVMAVMAVMVMATVPSWAIATMLAFVTPLIAPSTTILFSTISGIMTTSSPRIDH